MGNAEARLSLDFVAVTGEKLNKWEGLGVEKAHTVLFMQFWTWGCLYLRFADGIFRMVNLVQFAAPNGRNRVPPPPPVPRVGA